MEVAEDSDRVSDIVAGARSDAAAELVGALSLRLVEQAQVALEPDYGAKRESRIRDLVTIDLALLQDAQAPEY
jgi:hypothetical protein